MAIRVLCPNGHVLQVRDDLGGRVGRCPACKAIVQVPAVDDFPEDAIMHILGRPAPRPSRDSGDGEEPLRSRADHGHHGPPKKSCVKCHREIELGTHICPFCHTYIAGLADL
ncbi:MAG: hypothetical protein U1E05_05895 [Patescibacteria group bacterium]|nr:hypothetical protein [Patescibacteria group bacterium]